MTRTRQDFEGTVSWRTLGHGVTVHKINSLESLGKGLIHDEVHVCTQGTMSCLVSAAPVSPRRGPHTRLVILCSSLAGSSRVGTRFHSLRLVQGTRGSVVELKPSCGPAGAVEGQGGCSVRICS